MNRTWNRIWKRLKSIDQLKLENEWSYDDPDLMILIDGLGINEDMAYKFGDGVEYEFEESRSVYNDFTHQCMDDDWSYHESWFEVEEKEDMFSDEEFMI